MTSPHNPVFDALFETGARAVLSGCHRRDQAPRDGGRWPVSVVALPPPEMAERFHRATQNLLPYAGPGHFRTGRRDSVHSTVRALEPHLHTASPDDPITRFWCAAMDRVADRIGPVELVWTGLTLTTPGVLAQLETPDGAGWELMAAVRDELGAHGWYEDRIGLQRNIWYSSLLHFTGDLADPAGLVEWVTRHRRIEPVRFTTDQLALVRFRHELRAEGHAMVQQVWQRWALGG